jgi:VanZ family protein
MLPVFILTTIVILALTLFPSDYTLPKGFWDFDKLGHGLMFFFWTLFFGLFRFFQIDLKRPSLILILSVSAAFGLFIEILQFILPAGRSAEFYDFIADLIGSGIALWVLNLIFRSFPTLQDPHIDM